MQTEHAQQGLRVLLYSALPTAQAPLTQALGPQVLCDPARVRPTSHQLPLPGQRPPRSSCSDLVLHKPLECQ